MVHANLDLARRAVQRLGSRLPPHIGRDDLYAAGLLGLVNAARTFDPERGVPFVLYAARRVEGAVIDELRHSDWATRGMRRRERQIEDAIGPLANSLRHTPTVVEVATATGMAVSAIERARADRSRATLVQLERLLESGELDHVLPASDEGVPERAVVDHEVLQLVERAVTALPDRLRLVVRAQFFDSRTGTDVAAELGVSPARVLQLRREALVLLCDALGAPKPHLRDDRSGQPSTRRIAAYRAAFRATAPGARPKPGRHDQVRRGEGSRCAQLPSSRPFAAASAMAVRAAAS